MSRWLKRIFFVLVLGALISFLLPRIGGLQKDAEVLRHARWWLVVPALLLEAASLFAYVLLYRKVLTLMGHRVGVFATTEVTMAAFLVSHLVPGGSAAGTATNVDTMRDQGVPASTTGVAVAFTTLLSAVALLITFLVGLAYSFTKGKLPVAYLTTAAVVIPVLAGAAAAALLATRRPALAERIGRFIGRVIHRFRRNLNPEDSARDARVLSLQARGVLSGSGLAECLALALANWALDLIVLYLFFLAVGHHQHLGAVIVAYSIANLLAVLPITPGGLGIVEATLVALSIPFGAPRQIAVIAVIGYRLVNFWLPLPFGAAAYAHLTSSRRDRRREAAHGEGMS